MLDALSGVPVVRERVAAQQPTVAKRQRDKSAMGRYKRNKGAAGEREFAAAFRVLWPNVRRTAGESHPSVRGRDLLDTPPFCVQCHVGARPPIMRKLMEATLAAHGDIPIAVCRQDRQRATVTMWLEDWIETIVATRRDQGGKSDKGGARPPEHGDDLRGPGGNASGNPTG